jgi:hypothetical protein
MNYKLMWVQLYIGLNKAVYSLWTMQWYNCGSEYDALYGALFTTLFVKDHTAVWSQKGDVWYFGFPGLRR